MRRKWYLLSLAEDNSRKDRKRKKKNWENNKKKCRKGMPSWLFKNKWRIRRPKSKKKWRKQKGKCSRKSGREIVKCKGWNNWNCRQSQKTSRRIWLSRTRDKENSNNRSWGVRRRLIKKWYSEFLTRKSSWLNLRNSNDWSIEKRLERRCQALKIEPKIWLPTKKNWTG